MCGHPGCYPLVQPRDGRDCHSGHRGRGSRSHFPSTTGSATAQQLEERRAAALNGHPVARTYEKPGLATCCGCGKTMDPILIANGYHVLCAPGFGETNAASPQTGNCTPPSRWMVSGGLRLPTAQELAQQCQQLASQGARNRPVPRHRSCQRGHIGLRGFSRSLASALQTARAHFVTGNLSVVEGCDRRTGSSK